MSKRPHVTLLVLALCAALQGCGLKGDLYLEEPPEQSGSAQSDEADSSQTGNQDELDAGREQNVSNDSSGLEQNDLFEETFEDNSATQQMDDTLTTESATPDIATE